jgi:hypothetical protein
MRRYFQSGAKAAVWFLAFAAAITSARYFLARPPLLERTQILALSRHPFWILLHIAGGIVAITVGLFQFSRTLREARPKVHRAMGYLYLGAVLVAGCVSLQLSADTPVFAADALTDVTAIDLSFLGLSPAFLGYSASSKFSPKQCYPVMVGFATLGVAWLVTAGLALLRARQRRFDEHRAWMLRSYSLTFAAATVRLVPFPFLVLTRDPVVAITCTFWSWILNLVVAECIIRLGAKPARSAPIAA